VNVATGRFEPYVMPAAVAILTGLFVLQRRGTGGVGALFGPIMCVWFAVLGGLGVLQIAAEPAVLTALNPAYVIDLFATHQWHAFVALAVVAKEVVQPGGGG
jgi:KUP system potassium uptake protein